LTPSAAVSSPSAPGGVNPFDTPGVLPFLVQKEELPVYQQY